MGRKPKPKDELKLDGKKVTPLMRQYYQEKDKYPDSIMLFRMGDFFETFGEDAIVASKACGLTLTKRNNGGAGDIELAGFPHHQLDNYVAKLVRAGHRVAVCNQLEDPKLARGIVKRGVTEVITAGISLNEKLLDAKKNNFCCAVYLHKTKKESSAGIAFCDVSTGEFQTTEVAINKLPDVLNNIAPAEVILSKEQQKEIKSIIHSNFEMPSTAKLESWMFDEEFARDNLINHFKSLNLKGFGIEDKTAAVVAAGALLNYVSETQKDNYRHIQTLSLYDPSEYMTLDAATRRNLEILFSMHDDKNAALINVLDDTKTPMGGRLLKKWISNPLRKLESVLQRHDAVEALVKDPLKRQMIREELSHISDLERLMSKVATRRINPRELVNLRDSLYRLPKVKEILLEIPCKPIENLNEKLETLSDLAEMLKGAFTDEPTVQLGTGKVFKKGYNEELDRYVKAKTQGSDWIKEYQDRERNATDIQKLKVGFNNVFGYYIEVSRIHSDKVPDNYERKQTLANSERYTTPELKQIEGDILGAEEKIGELEKQLYEDVLVHINQYIAGVRTAAMNISVIDCLQSLAEVSFKNKYIRPKVDDSETLELLNARHPVVEKLLPPGTPFTPNSTSLDIIENQVHIITGPNMSGKSCYLRQTGLAVFLSQIGCFVPAESAHIGIVDRIFTRVGAQDNIAAGESTFLIEMQEAANIMNNATEKSLILLDEVGRGTATTDGIAIAWSITEYIHNHIAAKTLFATHYHELNTLAEKYERIHNYRIDVIGSGSNLIFTHEVKPGGSDKSFGIHVAKMAGLPFDVIERANELMDIFEGKDSENNQKIDLKKVKTKRDKHKPSEGQLAIFEIRDDDLRDKLRRINPDSLTPIEALQLLSELHREANK